MIFWLICISYTWFWMGSGGILRSTSPFPIAIQTPAHWIPWIKRAAGFQVHCRPIQTWKGEHNLIVRTEVHGKLSFPHKILCGKALCGPPWKSGILLKFPCLLWRCVSVMQIQRLSSGLGDFIHLKARTGGGWQCSADCADSNLHGGLLLACSEQQEAKGGGGMVGQTTALSFGCLR